MKIEWWDVSMITLAIGISKRGSVTHRNTISINKVDNVLNGLSFIKFLK